MKVALDTNILAYAEGANDASMKTLARALIQRLPQDATVIPLQAIGELFNVLTRKVKCSPHHARTAILKWTDTFPTLETSAKGMFTAIELAADHQLGIWDAVMLSTAAEADCRLFLSEDMQDGFTWNGVTVLNPFSPTPNSLLDALLKDTDMTEEWKTLDYKSAITLPLPQRVYWRLKNPGAIPQENGGIGDILQVSHTGLTITAQPLQIYRNQPPQREDPIEYAFECIEIKQADTSVPYSVIRPWERE